MKVLVEGQSEGGYVIESGRRLSQSALWHLQRDLYDARGIEAWSRGDVPQSITTSPYIARAYAHIVLGYLRDVTDQLDRSQPVYVVELGAGSGRFGFRFLKHMTRLLGGTRLNGIDITYVMTDVSPALIDFWQGHASLRSFIEAGTLDFGLFDAIHPGDLTLANSRVTLRAGAVANPLIVLGNYFFDSIPQDSFSVQDHQLFENLVKVVSDEPSLTLGAGKPLQDLRISFEAQPAPPQYYPEAALNAVLDGYRQRVDQAMFLFPVAGLACIRHFQALSDHRALFVIADIGSARESDIQAYTSGGIGGDSNFWLAVNFHAIGEYVQQLGGSVLHPPARHAHLNISAFVLDRTSSAPVETTAAFQETIGHLGPDDFFVLATVLANQRDAMGRGQLLAFLRASGWDTDFFLQCLPFLLESLQEIEWTGREDVRRAVAETWEMYFPMGETSDATDLPSGLGVVLYTIGDYAEAMEYFKHSLVLVGVDARTTFNVALCLNRLGRHGEASEWIDRTLELDPFSEQGLAMRMSLDSTTQ